MLLDDRKLVFTGCMTEYRGGKWLRNQFTQSLISFRTVYLIIRSWCWFYFHFTTFLPFTADISVQKRQLHLGSLGEDVLWAPFPIFHSLCYTKLRQAKLISILLWCFFSWCNRLADFIIRWHRAKFNQTLLTDASWIKTFSLQSSTLVILPQILLNQLWLIHSLCIGQVSCFARPISTLYESNSVTRFADRVLTFASAA